MLAGRLAGTVDGQHCEINAKGDTLDLKLSSIASAWRLRKSWPAVRGLCDSIVPYYGVVIRCSVPGLPSFNVAPTPPFWVRLFLPG